MQNKGPYVNSECVRITFNRLFSVFNIYYGNQALLMPSALHQVLLQPWAAASINLLKIRKNTKQVLWQTVKAQMLNAAFHQGLHCLL